MRVSTRQGRILDELVQEQGLTPGRYALFFVTGEGNLLPPGSEAPDALEELSGYILDDRGRVFAFWLGWDEARGNPALIEWHEETPASAWRTNDEYRRARRALGLIDD